MGCWRLTPSDQTDYPPRPLRSSGWDIFCLCYAIFHHIFDLGTDVNVTRYYFSKGETSYAIVTILIIIIPSIVTSCVSYRMYSMDRESQITPEESRCRKLQWVMLVLQLAPVQRYIDSLRYAWKSRKADNKKDQEVYYRKMLREDADAALLRVFESFLEAAPQQILQLSFLLKLYYTNDDEGRINSIISVLSSLVGMAFCLMTYQKSIRYVQDDKGNINWKGSVFIFMWHFCVTVSRILMLSAMVYISWRWTLIGMLVHWLVMTISLSILESHEFCSKNDSIRIKKPSVCETLANVLYSAVLGLVYIFTYITPGEGPSCFRYTSFYLICLLQNLVGAAVWYYYDFKPYWFTTTMTVMFIVPYLLGCLCMITYYCKFHPKQYTPPSIIPQRRQVDKPQGIHLAETPSPKLMAESSTSHNGTITSQLGEGDVA